VIYNSRTPIDKVFESFKYFTSLDIHNKSDSVNVETLRLFVKSSVKSNRKSNVQIHDLMKRVLNEYRVIGDYDRVERELKHVDSNKDYDSSILYNAGLGDMKADSEFEFFFMAILKNLYVRILEMLLF
jgi:hypothetical protein